MPGFDNLSGGLDNAFCQELVTIASMVSLRRVCDWSSATAVGQMLSDIPDSPVTDNYV